MKIVIGVCPYNKEIQCSEKNKCYFCGWNPQVHKRRVFKIREEMAKREA